MSSVAQKLSWQETALEMEASREDWSEWDATVIDGLDEVAWRVSRQPAVAEPAARYRAKQRPAKRR